MFNFEMKVHNCPSCGIKYGLPIEYSQKREDDGGSWYCPNGHSVVYSQSNKDKLAHANRKIKERDDNIQSWSDYSNDLQGNIDGLTNSLRATKGVVTKLRKKHEPEKFEEA